MGIAVQQQTRRSSGRRVAALMAASAVLPGSVQAWAGSERVGRFTLRVWGAVWAVIVLVVVGLLVLRGPTIALVLNPVFVVVAKSVLLVVALGWVALLLDAWWIARPLEMSGRTRGVSAAVVAVLVAAMVAATAFVGSALTALGDVGSIFGGSGSTDTKAGRFNILLLGGDSGPGRDGLRPDSIMVASIDATTGRTVLISLPRNMENAPIPASNPLHKLYPTGFDCPKSECMLNGIYTLAMEHKDLFPGVPEPGLKSTADVVGTVLGLDINYYALVDLAGFEALIDAVGGITLDVGRRIPIGGGSSKITGWIEVGKNQHLDGYHALWFARSRQGSSDYDRMARQKCVLNAMLNQLDPVTVSTRFGELAKAGKGMVTTSVPASELSRLIDLALLAKKLPTSAISFAPPLINPGRPDFAFIRAHVQQAIAASRALDDQTSSPSSSPATASSSAPATRPSSGTKPSSATPNSPTPESSPNAEQRDTSDLAAVCSVSR